MDKFHLRFNSDNIYTIYPTADNVFCNEMLDEEYAFETNKYGAISLWGCAKKQQNRQ
jgi:hypothetical protein